MYCYGRQKSLLLYPIPVFSRLWLQGAIHLLLPALYFLTEITVSAKLLCLSSYIASTSIQCCREIHPALRDPHTPPHPPTGVIFSMVHWGEQDTTTCPPLRHSDPCFWFRGVACDLAVPKWDSFQ